MTTPDINPAPSDAAPFDRVDLPSGGWATFRDPEQVTEKQRRPLKRLQLRIGMDSSLVNALTALSNDGAEAPVSAVLTSPNLTDEQVDLLSDFPDVVTLTLVDTWSYSEPFTLDGLQSLPARDYDALVMAAAKYQAALIPTFDVSLDKDSPTEPSAGSNAP